MKAMIFAFIAALACSPLAFSAQGCPEGTQIGRMAVILPSSKTPIVTTKLFQGTGASQLKQGLGHWSETALPGQGDTIVFSGHRTTRGSAWLHDLDLWPKGTIIRMHMTYPKRKSFCYKLSGTRIVSASGKRWKYEARSRGYEVLTTWACHPKGSVSHRIIGFWWPTKC